MDTTAQIKKNLIDRIKNSKDLNLLNALQTMFDSSDQNLYPLSSDQQASIETSRNEVHEGEFRKHDDVITDMKQGLKKK